MGEVIFILGGARSGKSAYAIDLAKRLGEKAAFIATCSPLDREMEKRVKLHRRKRPTWWQTFEETKDLSSLLKRVSYKFNVIIIDCLTILVSNLLLEGLNERVIEGIIKKVFKELRSIRCKTIVVSNEVGLGIVPDNNLGRRFRDLAGRINQMVAKESDSVFFMVSGLPLKIK